MSDSALPPSFSSSTVRPPVEVFVVQPSRPRYWVHVLLLAATVFTTLVIGARMEFNFQNNQPAFALTDSGLPLFPVRWAFANPARLLLGIPFSATLMLILLAHEMGHYLYCRHYGVNATLPFFIPAPTLIGTLGAFIRIRSPIRSRSALFDIGIAGPIAGFAVAFPVLLVSLGLSKGVPPGMPPSDIQLGFPLIFRWTHWLMAVFSPSHSIARVPLEGVYLHPTAIAAWVGMFATALNLLPGGQLDGGHIVFSLNPRVHRRVSRLTIAALVPMAIYFWLGWLLWAVLLAITGMRHPMVPEWPGVTGRRRWVALFGLLMLMVTLTPAPFADGSLLAVLRDVRRH